MPRAPCQWRLAHREARILAPRDQLTQAPMPRWTSRPVRHMTGSRCPASFWNRRCTSEALPAGGARAMRDIGRASPSRGILASTPGGTTARSGCSGECPSHWREHGPETGEQPRTVVVRLMCGGTDAVRIANRSGTCHGQSRAAGRPAKRPRPRRRPSRAERGPRTRAGGPVGTWRPARPGSRASGDIPWDRVAAT